MFSANVCSLQEYLQNAFAISFGFCIILVLIRNLSFIELLSFVRPYMELRACQVFLMLLYSFQIVLCNNPSYGFSLVY